MRRWWTLIKNLFSEFGDDECTSRAGALAYYSVLSLPPLLVIVILVLGIFYERNTAQQALEAQVRGLVGQGGAEAFLAMIQHARAPGRSVISFTVWVVALIAGSSGVFGQLQSALNRIWEVKPDAAKGGIRNFITKRLLSFSMVLGIAFLLLISLVISAALTAFSGVIEAWLPQGFSVLLLQLLNGVVSLFVITMLFAAMFKILPDAHIQWRDVWIGAGVTALLFVVGKTAIGAYLSKSDVGSAYGAAGSLVLVLVWLYYSCLIFLFGAEFTQVWARRDGHDRPAEAGAMKAARVEINEHGVQTPRVPLPFQLQLKVQPTVRPQAFGWMPVLVIAAGLLVLRRCRCGARKPRCS